jgi:hypothetical protein
MSVWSDASDDWDPAYDTELFTYDAPGYAGVYHEKNVGGWTGPTAFYFNDYRAPITPDEGKTWSPIFVWADPIYGGELMAFSMEADADNPPPVDRRYFLELLTVPDGVTGAPPEGTVWSLPLDQLLTLILPTYRTADGRTGYKFAYTVMPVPEPGTLTGLGLVALFLRRPRRR